MAIKPLKTIKFPGLPDTYTVPQVDSAPTQDSPNAVSSGGVYDALQIVEHQISPTWIEGGSINKSTGEFAGNSDLNWTYTQFYEIPKSSKIRLSVYASGNAAGVAFYDSNKTFISGTNVKSRTNTDLREYNVPTNAVFVRFTNNVDSNYHPDTPLIILLSDKTDAIVDKIPQVDATPTQNSTNAVSSGGVYDALDTLQAQIPQIDSTLSQSGQAAGALETGFGINTIREPTRNLNNQIMGRWRARASGVIQESNVNYFGMRDMIPCEPDTAYTVSFGDVEYTGTMHIYTTWYDSSKTIISQSDNTQGSSLSATNTSPSNAAYIYANINIGTGITYTEDSWIQIEKGTMKTEHVPPYAPRGVTGNTENIADILNVLQYKTVMARDNIPANANIDDYKQPGVYSVTTDENAQTLANWPDTRRGELIVFNSRGSDNNYSYGKVQFVFTPNAYTYIRQYVSNNTKWSAWFRLANASEVQSVSEELETVKYNALTLHLPDNPYKAVATKTDSNTGKKTWSDKIRDIKSTCHLHVSLAVHFKKAVDKGYEHLAISNYHASVPTVPIKDILPTLSGYDQSVHVVPDYWVESPNAEHVYFTGEATKLHMNAIGSYLSSGSDNTGVGSGGFGGTTDEFFELAMEHLKYANGGGVSINHPAWSELTADKIISLYDKGSVFAIEIYNADCEYHSQNGYSLTLWDAVLSTGRQVFGLAVPDHSAESSSNPDWATWPWGYNHMLCRTSDEAEILTAYRNGRFYTTIDNDTLALNYFGVDSGVATIITSEPGTITFTTKTRSVVTENATEASLTLTSEDGYVRASCETATNKLFTNAIML